jgi:hypothetical protein
MLEEMQEISEDDVPSGLDDFEFSLALMAALGAATATVSGSGPAERARMLARHALEALPEGAASSAELCVIQNALRTIAGKPPLGTTGLVPASAPWTRRTFETLALAWATWVSDDTAPLALTAHALRTAEPPKEDDQGAVELEALRHWATALELLESNRPLARRWFDRAVFASEGTESSLAISWTFVATFFPAA